MQLLLQCHCRAAFVTHPWRVIRARCCCGLYQFATNPQAERTTAKHKHFRFKCQLRHVCSGDCTHTGEKNETWKAWNPRWNPTRKPREEVRVLPRFCPTTPAWKPRARVGSSRACRRSREASTGKGSVSQGFRGAQRAAAAVAS